MTNKQKEAIEIVKGYDTYKGMKVEIKETGINEEVKVIFIKSEKEKFTFTITKEGGIYYFAGR